jgi:hypothetical protein
MAAKAPRQVARKKKVSKAKIKAGRIVVATKKAKKTTKKAGSPGHGKFVEVELVAERARSKTRVVRATSVVVRKKIQTVAKRKSVSTSSTGPRKTDG